VVSGKATFGIGRSSLLIQRSRGKEIILLGAAFQHSPLVLITTDENINDINDLKGKRMMITDDAGTSASLLGMLFSNGIKADEIRYQKHSFDYKDLVNKKTDAMASYVSNETYFLEKDSIPYQVFDPSDYGFDFYEDILFSSERLMQKDPELIQKFREATVKGWTWAYENIEETADLIYEKYNTQNKPLDALVHEGKVLKKYAIEKGVPLFSINKKKIKNIARVFQLREMLDKKCNVDNVVYEFKKKVKIGVLAKRGVDETLRRWDSLSEYLSKELEYYDFEIVPLTFNEMQNSVRDAKVDFVITNTMYYVILESRYGVSRIATLVNSDKYDRHELKQFGGVIFTKSTNKNIKTLKDVEDKKFGAVSELSFGGWIMAYEELIKHNIDLNNMDIIFLGTHDAVVEAVLASDVEAGTVRTDTLERMANEGKIKLSDIKVIDSKEYDDFPYLVSTDLYPEWPIAKLVHTSDTLANKLLAKLVSYESSAEDIVDNNIKGWTVPLDYSKVHEMLKELRLEPYERVEVRFEDILNEYATFLYILSVIALLLIARLFYDYKYNKELDMAVKEKTSELIEANKKLKVLANQDFLTGISNRAHFMKFARKYFEIAKRNKGELQMLSLDLDHFKDINDTYGHHAGDCVLKEFTNRVSSMLRKSDLFGRVGGEEFCIVLQNTSLEGAKNFANRICRFIEKSKMDCDGEMLSITVSIGIASLDGEDSVEELIKYSDKALYEAKENGRNQAKIYNEY
jgi:diguanylate cyclase (GGDEF)-like protein